MKYFMNYIIPLCSVILTACSTPTHHTHSVQNIDFVSITIKTPLSNFYENHVTIWIEKQNSQEHLDIENSLTNANISFDKIENAYFIHNDFSSFLVRDIPITMNNKHVIVNHQDITDIGNVVISKNSEMTLGAFYASFRQIIYLQLGRVELWYLQ